MIRFAPVRFRSNFQLCGCLSGQGLSEKMTAESHTDSSVTVGPESATMIQPGICGHASSGNWGAQLSQQMLFHEWQQPGKDEPNEKDELGTGKTELLRCLAAKAIALHSQIALCGVESTLEFHCFYLRVDQKRVDRGIHRRTQESKAARDRSREELVAGKAAQKPAFYEEYQNVETRIAQWLPTVGTLGPWLHPLIIRQLSLVEGPQHAPTLWTDSRRRTLISKVIRAEVPSRATRASAGKEGWRRSSVLHSVCPQKDACFETPPRSERALNVPWSGWPSPSASRNQIDSTESELPIVALGQSRAAMGSVRSDPAGDGSPENPGIACRLRDRAENRCEYLQGKKVQLDRSPARIGPPASHQCVKSQRTHMTIQEGEGTGRGVVQARHRDNRQE